MNAYPIGNDLTVKWSLLYSDGFVFPLSNYDYELSYRTNRGNKVVTDTSVISVDENILTWTFKGDEQVVSGRYTICLKITLSGSKVVELQYDNAFMLSPLSGFKGAGSEIVLQSYCDAIDLKEAVLQARKAMDLAANAVIDTANSAADAKAAKEAAEVTAAQAKADAESAKTMAADAKDKVAVAEKAATDASRDAVAAQQAAQTVSDHITSLQQAIAELPDGQAVTEKVAEHTTKLSDLEGGILDIRGGEIVKNYTSEDFKEVASSWSISSNKVVNIAPSNPNARALTNPIHLNVGDKVVLRTAIYSAYQYMYIVADAEQNVILSVQPTGEAGVLETLEYTATSECYFYANGMTTKDFSCAVTSEKVGSLEELKSRVTDLEKEVNGQEEKHTDTDYSTFGISHNYFSANLEVVSSTRYDMTDYIPVSKGNVIIISAQSDPGIAMVVGYSDNQGNGATALLTGNVQVANKEVLIPNGVNYVRCCARNLAFSQVTALMSVTLRVIESIAYEGINQKIDALDVRIDSLEVSTIGDKIVVPKNKKILLVGASFTIPGNGWDKLVQDTLGCEIVNKAVGGSNIINNVADLMLDADASKPHGSLFMVNGVDIFNDVSALVIQHVHNKNVLLDKALYEQRDTAWYKTNGIPSGDYASGFDYVLKQYKEWCSATASVTETIQDVTRESIYGTHPCQILLVSHWLPSRALYNATSRQLASRFNVSYCPIDTNVGISAKDMVYCTESTDAQPTPTLGYYNPSVLLAQFVNVASGNPIGKTEVIDGVTWGWHPLLLSSTRNYGYGTIVNRQGVTQYVPYIARLIANIVVDCIKVFE